MPYVSRRGLGSSITELITSIANSKGVPPAMALAVAQHESGFNPNAKNPNSSAAGLFQLVNAAQQNYGVTNPYDPTQNTTAGVSFLSDMLKRYNGNQDLALMAYAWGPGNVDKYIATGQVPAGQQANFDMSKEFASYVDVQTGSASSFPSFDSSPAVISDSSGDSSSFDLSSLIDGFDSSVYVPVLGILGLGVALMLMDR